MKPVQIIFLGVSILAGGAAFLLSGRLMSPQKESVVIETKVPGIAQEDILVATKDIPIGTRLQDTDVVWRAWPLESIGEGMIRRSENASAVMEIKGALSRVSFSKGEPLRMQKIIKTAGSGFMSAILPQGKRAVAITIDTQGGTTAGGFILPNDRVDVIRVFRDEAATQSGAADPFASETILKNVRVLAIGPNIQEKNGERVVTGTTATLELTQSEAESIVMAQRGGQLSLTLRSLEDSQGQKDESDAVKSESALSVIKYGVLNRISR